MADRATKAERHVTGASRMWMLYAALGAAAILVYYLLPKAGVAQAVLLTAANGSAAAAALWRAVRTSRLNRLVWSALASAMTLSTLANGPYYLYPHITGHALSFPGPVDILWLLTYPCFVVALLALGKQRSGGQVELASQTDPNRVPAATAQHTLEVAYYVGPAWGR